MDIVWIAALVALWVAMAEAVVLLGRFDGPKGSIAVIALDVLYGFGAIVAVVLFAYLVFALICAEEF